MIIQFAVIAIALVVGIGLGAWLNRIAFQWEAANKEPNPSLVRNRKEIVAALLVVGCVAILILGITTKDRSGGFALVAVSIVPLMFLLFELLQERHLENVRGYNALAYFVFNVVAYGVVRIFHWFPGTFESLNAISTIAFFQVTLGAFIVDVIASGVVGFLSTDSGAEGFIRAVPMYLKAYAVMLALLGLLLIISS